MKRSDMLKTIYLSEDDLQLLLIEVEKLKLEHQKIFDDLNSSLDKIKENRSRLKEIQNIVDFQLTEFEKPNFRVIK